MKYLKLFEKLSKDTYEKIADIQHEIWSHWMKYMFSCGKFDKDGNWIMPKDKVDRWKKQMETPYKKLSEREKQSDREQVDKFKDLI